MPHVPAGCSPFVGTLLFLFFRGMQSVLGSFLVLSVSSSVPVSLWVGVCGALSGLCYSWGCAGCISAMPRCAFGHGVRLAELRQHCGHLGGCRKGGLLGGAEAG